MTRKHFIAIAKAYAAKLESGADRAMLRSMAETECGVFASINPAFDKARFLAACGF
jgi:hypothetical protein